MDISECILSMQVLFFSLGVFVLGDDGNVLTASQIFTSLIVFRLLRPAVMDLCWLFSGLEQVIFLLSDIYIKLYATVQ